MEKSVRQNREAFYWSTPDSLAIFFRRSLRAISEVFRPPPPGLRDWYDRKDIRQSKRDKDGKNGEQWLQNAVHFGSDSCRGGRIIFLHARFSR
ncbi:MAG: hypothetical protein WDM70_01085 [Nitrosomonadales bacterium]